MEPTNESQKSSMLSLRALCEEQGIPCYDYTPRDEKGAEGEFVALATYGCRFTYHPNGLILGKWWYQADCTIQKIIMARFAHVIVWADYHFDVGGAFDAISAQDFERHKK